MNSVVNLKDGFITFNSNIDHSLSFSKCAIGYSNYNINSHERGSLVFLTNNNANDTNISMNDIRMCIASDGNVGIGTNNPGYKLDIQGASAQTLRILDTRAAGDAIVALKETNDNNGFDMAYIGATDDRFYIRGYNNSSTPRVDLAIDRITSNVGIGMTNPKYKLDVAGTINASNILINGATVTANSLQWITSSSNVYTSNLSGNVGIGTNNPGYKLDVNGSINIPAGSKYKINGYNLAYSNIDGTLPAAGIGTSGTLGGVKVDGSTITINNNIISATAQLNSDWNETNTASKAFIQNKPTITAQLNSDWNETNTASKAFIQNKPTITAQVNSDWNETNTASKAFILNKPTITAQVNSDWNETNTVSKAFILNKPTITSSQWTTNGTNIYYSTGNIGIGTNTNIQSKLTINGIDIGLANNINHSEAPLTITNPTATSTSVLNDPKAVLNLCRTGTSGQAYSARACFKLCRYENSSTNSRTRLDITLAHGAYDDLNIMSLQSGGNVGIGITNPEHKLDINGGINCTTDIRVGGDWYWKATKNMYLQTSANNLEWSMDMQNQNTYTGCYWQVWSDKTGLGSILACRGDTGNVGIRNTAPGYALDVTGDINITGSFRVNGTAFTSSSSQWTTNGTNIYYNSGNVGIGITNPSVRLDINGNVKIQASRVAIQSSGFAINNNYMGPDTLTIGNQDINYGGGQNWNTNTAGLMFECRDHTEIAVHDSGNYVHSFMWYYQNSFTIGRNMGWGAPNVNIAGNLIVAGNLNVNTSKLVIRGTEPTLYLRDTNNRSGMIHMNSSIMYFLNASGNDSETWAQQNGQDWCLQLNMDNNTATFGGNLNVNGNIAHRTENWHTSSDGRNRFYFAASGATYYSGGMSGGANARMHEWRRTYDDATLGWFENTGLIRSWGYSSLSDERIKKNIRDIDDVQALEKILLIQPKKYNYIEKERNKHDVIGFIAQQIGEVIPEAITKTEGIVPNIYKNCSVINKREIQHSISLNVPIDTDIIITDTEDGTGERYKIKEIYDDYFVIDKDIDRNEVFVKGYSINDLHNLDKNYIYTLNVCATQELHKIIVEQKNKINDLESRLLALEAIVMKII
jgi:hypothetical protein